MHSSLVLSSVRSEEPRSGISPRASREDIGGGHGDRPDRQLPHLVARAKREADSLSIPRQCLGLAFERPGQSRTVDRTAPLRLTNERDRTASPREHHRVDLDARIGRPPWPHGDDTATEVARGGTPAQVIAKRNRYLPAM